MEARTETDRRRTCSEIELEAAVDALDRSPRLVAAGEWPADLGGLDSAGLYSWWVDREGAGDLAKGLGDHLPAGWIYAGQAGATKWPSGARGSATLASRVGGNHLRGKVRNSTFRLTLAAALVEPLDLELIGSKKLSSASERRLSEWIGERLEVAVHPFGNRNSLADLEKRVLAELDPPLNLSGRVSTPLRNALSRKREAIAVANESTGRTSSAPARSSSSVLQQRSRSSVTLHEEIAAILRESGRRWMTTTEIAQAVSERGQYTKRDDSTVDAFQIHGRTRKYSHLFVRDGSWVGLKDDS